MDALISGRAANHHAIIPYSDNLWKNLTFVYTLWMTLDAYPTDELVTMRSTNILKYIKTFLSNKI